MEKDKTQSSKWPLIFCLGAAIGAVMFLLIYGVNILDPTRDAWLLNYQGDGTQHYIGWEFFRKSQWHFPIGLTDGLIDEQPISIIFTDSIPLLAVFFKLLSPMLPETFQYMGIWGLFSFAMQGGISSLILLRITKNPAFSLIGCIVYIVCPPVLQRMYGHEALAGQWVILIAILSWVCQNRQWKFKASPIILWALNGIIAVSIHMYFVPMIYFIMMGYFITDFIANKKILRPILCFVSTTASTLLTMYVLGAFYGSSSYAAGGLGVYSSNFNTFFNGDNNSKFIKAMNKFDGQGEGFAYLGLGVILGGALAIMLIVIKSEKKGLIRTFKDLPKTKRAAVIGASLIFVITFLYAASPKGTLNARVIYEIKLPEIVAARLSIFRATGRFSWIAEYIIYTSVMYVISRIPGKKSVIFAIVLLTSVQLLDLKDIMKARNYNDRVMETYASKLVDPKWDEIGKKADEILFAPLPESYLVRTDLFYEFGEYADEYDLDLSCFAVARGEYANLSKIADEKLDSMINGTADENIIVVFFDEKDVPKKNKNIKIYDMDDFLVATNF
ncbi:MAG: DUF6311 domain-containing protein [Ruminococcus sp.]|nr:DUF6311 domain-containing protein [Ruminococcus sp.]